MNSNENTIKIDFDIMIEEMIQWISKLEHLPTIKLVNIVRMMDIELNKLFDGMDVYITVSEHKKPKISFKDFMKNSYPQSD